MKILRSVDIYFNHLTDKKKQELSIIRKEYHTFVQSFINKYQDVVPLKDKNELRLKKYTHSIPTWLSARLIQNGIGEAWDLIHATKESCKEKNIIYKSTAHHPDKMVLSEQICNICLNPKTKGFDLNITLTSIGEKKRVSIPLKKHRLFNKWLCEGKLCKSVTLFPNHVTFTFKIETGEKKTTGNYLGVDIGMNILLATSDGKKYGCKITQLVKKLNRRQRCSKEWYRCQQEIREYIDRTCKQLPWESLQLIVCENLKNLKHKTKQKNKKGKRRLSKAMRRVISNWNYRYILQRLKQLSEENRVSFRSVSPWNTSVTCFNCGYADKGNRLIQESFYCLKCGHSDNADNNAAKVILNRFLTGKYGSCFQGNNC